MNRFGPEHCDFLSVIVAFAFFVSTFPAKNVFCFQQSPLMGRVKGKNVNVDLQMAFAPHIYSRTSFWHCSCVPFAGQKSGTAGRGGCTGAGWLHIPCDWRSLPGGGLWNLQQRGIPVETFKWSRMGFPFTAQPRFTCKRWNLKPHGLRLVSTVHLNEELITAASILAVSEDLVLISLLQ